MRLVKVLVHLHRDVAFSYIFARKYLTKYNKTVTATYSEAFPYTLANFCLCVHIVLSISVLYGRAKRFMVQSVTVYTRNVI